MTSPPSLRNQLIGAWELISYHAYLPSDPSNKVYPMGPHANGIIMYTPDGYMSAQLVTPGQPVFKPAEGTASDFEAQGRNAVSYTGAFYLDEKGDENGPLLVHEMRSSSSPVLVGDRQRRLVEIKEEEDGRYLYLSTAKPVKQLNGEERIPLVRWKRLPLNERAREPEGKL